MGINVAQFVRQWAMREGSRPALLLPGSLSEGIRSVSYGELDRRASRSAAFLQRSGLEVGSRIAVCLPNELGFLDAFLGGLYAGCTLIPVPPMSAAPELAQRLVHGRCSGLITDSRTRDLGNAALGLAQGSVLHMDAQDLLADDEPGRTGPCDLPAGAVAMLLYTSGTTGVAKGAMITHASLATHTAALVHHVLRLTSADLVLAALPLTHSYGIRMTLLAPFYAGARSLLLERFDAARVAALLDDEAVTWFPGVPTMFHALAHLGGSPRRAPPGTLRWCLSAGAPLAPEIRRRFESHFKVPLRQGFGLTEATFSTVSLPEDEGGADSVGQPVFGVEVRICDEQGELVPSGSRGEICVRGQNVMAGYFDDPEATAQVLSAGWLRTGDVGVLDEEGRLSVVDRIKDMIVRGGFNVYPAEVEAVLLTHPDVHQAVVVGLADERYGEEVVAAVVLSPGAQLDSVALSNHCRKYLSPTKLPRLWAELTSIPMGPSGKLLRRAVRAMLDGGELAIQRPQVGP